jgi:hypothetical protein
MKMSQNPLFIRGLGRPKMGGKKREIAGKKRGKVGEKRPIYPLFWAILKTGQSILTVV